MQNQNEPKFFPAVVLLIFFLLHWLTCRFHTAQLVVALADLSWLSLLLLFSYSKCTGFRRTPSPSPYATALLPMTPPPQHQQQPPTVNESVYAKPESVCPSRVSYYASSQLTQVPFSSITILLSFFYCLPSPFNNISFFFVCVFILHTEFCLAYRSGRFLWLVPKCWCGFLCWGMRERGSKRWARRWIRMGKKICDHSAAAAVAE